MKQINPTVIERQHELRKQFVNNEPFRNVVIDNVLETEFCQRLLDDFPAFDEKFARNENAQIGRKAARDKVTSLGKHYRALDALVKSTEFLQLISTITSIQDLCYDPSYVGGGTHENLNGQELDPHVDFNFHPGTGKHRRLNLILYLNHGWRPEWGGCLDLHRDPYLPPAEDTIVRVAPEFNRCVIFETNEYSWHGFEPIELPADQRDRTRKSFALYYYTDQRPAEEVALHHSTIYVERHLPEDIRAGEPLSEEDLRRIRLLLARRDQHIRRLYGELQERPAVDVALAQTTIYADRPLPEDLRAGETLSAENLSRIRTLVDRRDRHVKRLYAEIRRLSQQLNHVYASHSWKITAPLRALRRILARKK